MLDASVSQPPAWIQVPKHDADLVVVVVVFLTGCLIIFFMGILCFLFI